MELKQISKQYIMTKEEFLRKLDLDLSEGESLECVNIGDAVFLHTMQIVGK